MFNLLKSLFDKISNMNQNMNKNSEQRELLILSVLKICFYMFCIGILVAFIILSGSGIPLPHSIFMIIAMLAYMVMAFIEIFPLVLNRLSETGLVFVINEIFKYIVSSLKLRLTHLCNFFSFHKCLYQNYKKIALLLIGFGIGFLIVRYYIKKTLHDKNKTNVFLKNQFVHRVRDTLPQNS